MIKKFFTYLSSNSGATAVEYGLIAAVITLVIIVGISAFGQNLNQFFFETLPGILNGS